MTTITIFDGNSTIEVEVEDSFALTYKAMAKRDELDERRETRRHQSLNASMDNGFDFKDESVDYVPMRGCQRIQTPIYSYVTERFPYVKILPNSSRVK